MISHSLFRNITTVYIVFIYFLFRKNNMNLYKICYNVLLKIVLPLSIILSFFNISIVQLFIFDTWRTMLSYLQYLLFLCLSVYMIKEKTLDYSYSLTMSYVMCVVVGYLYEIPMWIKLNGVLTIIRISRMSLLHFDVSMLSPIIFYVLLTEYKYKYNKLMIVSIMFYLFYCYVRIFYVHYILTISVWLDIPFVFLLRIPALILMLSFSLGIEDIGVKKWVK